MVRDAALLLYAASKQLPTKCFKCESFDVMRDTSSGAHVGLVLEEINACSLAS
jgi:hypothetical protein